MLLLEHRSQRKPYSIRTEGFNFPSSSEAHTAPQLCGCLGGMVQWKESFLFSSSSFFSFCSFLYSFSFFSFLFSSSIFLKIVVNWIPDLVDEGVPALLVEGLFDLVPPAKDSRPQVVRGFRKEPVGS